MSPAWYMYLSCLCMGRRPDYIIKYLNLNLNLKHTYFFYAFRSTFAAGYMYITSWILHRSNLQTLKKVSVKHFFQTVFPESNKNSWKRVMKRGAWSSIHIVLSPASVCAVNLLYCMGWLGFWGYRDYFNFTNCPRTFGGHCRLKPGETPCWWFINICLNVQYGHY